MSGIRKILACIMLCSVITATGCHTEKVSYQDQYEDTESSENLVVNNMYALAASYDEEVYNEPFSSYTYDFSVYDSNYMITVTPDETMTGLNLTVEDNQFGFSNFSVIPPEGYMVMLPHTSQQASEVCTVIKGNSNGDTTVPDLLKIDFCLVAFEDETLPYTVSRLYSIFNNRLVEVELYNTTDENGLEIFEPMKYIPDSELYRTELNKFMSYPAVTVNDDGSLSAEVITYEINYNDMTMRRAYEDISSADNALYYGYGAHAIAGEIHKYFATSSLNVSDYKNYVEVPSSDSENSLYFFRVDDPRFSTLDELKEYVCRFFDNELAEKMFLSAPQQYRDIDGALHTVIDNTALNRQVGKLIITDWEQNGNVITYHTQQETLDTESDCLVYTDSGDFVIEIDNNSYSSAGSFLIKEYHYPFL